MASLVKIGGRLRSVERSTRFVWQTHWPVSYTHLRAHETPEHLVCRLLLEKKQPSWCQLKAHGWFPIWPPLSQTSYLSPFSRYLTLKLFFHRSWWGLIPLPVWRIEILGFPPKTIGNHISWDSTLMASLVKIGLRLRSVERSTRFVWQADWLTDSLTHRHTTDFIICPMLLMHWADN